MAAGPVGTCWKQTPAWSLTAWTASTWAGSTVTPSRGNVGGGSGTIRLRKRGRLRPIAVPAFLRPVHAGRATVGRLSVVAGASVALRPAWRTGRAWTRPVSAMGGATVPLGLARSHGWLGPLTARGITNPTDEQLSAIVLRLIDQSEADAIRAYEQLSPRHIWERQQREADQAYRASSPWESEQ